MKPSGARSDPTIASLVVHNLKALTSLADTLKPAHEYTSLAGSQLARFKLWSASLGAHRATGNRALEYRLRDASSIKNQILSLLQDLSTVLDQAHVGVHEQPDQLQDDLELNEIDAYFLRDDSPTQSSLDRSLAVIGHILDCLLRLCITISNPAPHDQFQSRAGAIVSAYYEPWDVRHVQEKFRDVDPIIAERLGRAITIRRQYFRYRKEHHDKLAEGLGNEDDIGGDRTTIASSIPEHLKDTPGITALLEDLDTKSEFSATSYAPSNAEPDQLRHYSTHIGHHLESLALFSLPRIEGNDDMDDGSEVRPDLRPEDEAQYEDDSSISSEIVTLLMKEAFQLRDGLEEVINPSTESKEHLNVSVEVRWANMKADVRQELETRIREETERLFKQNMEESDRLEALGAKERSDAADKAKKEIEEAKQAAETASQYLIEKEGQAAAEQDQTNAERMKRETELATAAEAAAKAKLMAAIKAKEKAEETTQKKMVEMAEWRKLLETEAKLKAENEAREKMSRD
ncbi:hypothetical protein E8E14_010089 [Neopestalotiopsis sp. 37M]|nr:hypothetical protein E8E14_010089 [Neopestalotiopsis sp. 37M]